MITRMSELFLRTLPRRPLLTPKSPATLLIRRLRPADRARLYSRLPLGLKVLRKIESVVRDDGRDRRAGDPVPCAAAARAA